MGKTGGISVYHHSLAFFLRVLHAFVVQIFSSFRSSVVVPFSGSSFRKTNARGLGIGRVESLSPAALQIRSRYGQLLAGGGDSSGIEAEVG